MFAGNAEKEQRATLKLLTLRAFAVEQRISRFDDIVTYEFGSNTSTPSSFKRPYPFTLITPVPKAMPEPRN